MRKWWKDVLSLKARSPAKRNVQHRSLRFENLEERRLLTVTLTPVQPLFIQDGPAPITNPNSNTNTELAKSSVGAVQAIVADTGIDSSGNTVFVGTVNGGVWVTKNYTGTGSGPTWTPITDQDILIPTTSGTPAPTSGTPGSGFGPVITPLPTAPATTPPPEAGGSLSISALAVNNSTTLPNGTQGQALVAANGNYSDVGLNNTGIAGGGLNGVWEDLNPASASANSTWYQVAGIPTGKNYAAVAVGSDSTLSGTNTEYIMAAANGGAQYFTPLTIVTNTVGGCTSRR